MAFKRIALVMVVLVIAGLGFVWWYDSTGQRPDLDFDTRVELPAYPSGPVVHGGRHPRVVIDEAHRNFHTAGGLYRPFAELLRNDGYTVSSNRRTFGAEVLKDVDVLVIANAMGPGEHERVPSRPRPRPPPASPAKATPDAGETADGQLAWAAMPAAVRNACTQSTTQWYDNYTNFQKVGSKRYFLNHWYHRPFTIGATAFATIPSTNDTYTAMSEKEFFANCYAEYFENPEGVKDHSKWGGTLPASVKSFFATCIVGRQPYDKFQKKKTANKNNH